MYKFIFELLKEPLGLPISPLYEYLLLLIVNEIVFRIAWNESPGGKWGSAIHWLIRVGIFFILWAILYLIIFVGQLIIANWVFVISIIFGVIGIIILFIKIKGVEK